jgi:O-antigen/teichoic acid export membrane protein
MSRTKSAFWGSVSSQMFMIISMLLSVVVTPLILKFLNKEEYGFYTILFQIIGYLSMLDFGLGSAITRSLAANRGEDKTSQTAINKIISTSFFTYSFLGAIVIIVGLFFTPYVPHFFKMADNLSDVAVSITLTLSIFVGIQFPIKVFNSIFYAHQKQFLSNLIGFTINLFNSILPLILLYFGQGLWSFVYTNIICSAVEIIIMFSLIRKFYPFLKVRFNFFEKALLTDLVNFGFFFFLGNIAYQVVFFTDRFFIGSFVSLAAATMFALSVKAPELCRELIFRITDNAYPAMVEISTKENENKLKTVHNKLLLITVCLSCIAFWIIYIINQWFLNLWVGEEYFIGQPTLLLALLVMFQLTFLHVEVLCLWGMGTVKVVSLIGIIEAVINIALTIFLGKMYGITGILVSTIIAGWLTVGWLIPYMVMKKLNITLKAYLFKPLLLPILSISSFGFIIYFFTRDLFRTIQLNWLSFSIVAIIIAVLFVLFIWILFLRKEFSQYIPMRFKKYLLINSL